MNNHVQVSVALAACASLLIAYSISAQGTRVGVLTANYTLSGSGSYSYSYSEDEYEWETIQDQIQVTATGSLQYVVLFDGTNMSFTGSNEISTNSSETITVTGSGFEDGDYAGAGCDASWTYFSPAHLLSIYLDTGSGDAWPDASGGFDSWLTGSLECGGFWQGANIELSSVLENSDYYFSLTDPKHAWSGSFTTNGSASEDGAEATATFTIALSYVSDQLLTTGFTAAPTNGFVPLTVQFGSQPTDSNGSNIVSWYWDFGDGTNGTGMTCSHTYVTNTNGVFKVTLAATNVNGSAVRGVGPSNIAVTMPTAQFTAFPTTGWMPFPVAFSGPSADSGGSAIQSWSWNFGDKTGSTYQSPSHVYIWTNTKAFSPKLLVVNSAGLQLAASGPKITAWYPPVDFSASPTNGLIPLRVIFSAPAVDAFGLAITNWKWNFGDGSTNTAQNPTHIYTDAGIFTPTLLATNANKTAVLGSGPSIAAGCLEVHVFGGSGGGFDPMAMAFTNGDGMYPRGGLVAAGNQLYGVMAAGGPGGSGTIFAINTDGSGFTNLYSFSPMEMYANSDGATPVARLVLAGDTLYGACSGGGTLDMMLMRGGGTLFRLNINGGCFTNLYSFLLDTNGGAPNGLVVCGGELYGTTEYGGSNAVNMALGDGAVFKIATDGTGIGVVHSFGNSDGSQPEAGLLVSGNTLYGTTYGGGQYGDGTVFKVNTDGSGFAVLHHFTGSDGENPTCDLVLAGGTLYGTTSSGAANGSGSVFKVNTNGTNFATLYNFSATGAEEVFTGSTYNIVYTNSDGANPRGGLLLHNGGLYGTTESGGINGSGTIFALDTNGMGVTNAFTFSALEYGTNAVYGTNLDGANPYCDLAVAGDMLYATLCNGGAQGKGSVFGLSLAEGASPLDIQRAGAGAVIYWPLMETGWTLQQNTNLANSAGWSDSSLTIGNDGTNSNVALTPSGGPMFFRLMKK